MAETPITPVPDACPSCSTPVSTDGRGSWLCSGCGDGKLLVEPIESAEELSRRAVAELEDQLRIGAHSIARSIVAAELDRRRAEHQREQDARAREERRAERRMVIAKLAARG